MILVGCAGPSRPPSPVTPGPTPEPGASVDVDDPFAHRVTDLTGEDRDALEHADSMTILRLDPNAEKSQDPEAPHFRAWAVRAQAVVSTPAARQQVATLVERSVREADEMLCFNPRHVVSVRKGAETVDFVICYECQQMLVFSRSPHHLPVTRQVGAEMEALFRSLGAGPDRDAARR